MSEEILTRCDQCNERIENWKGAIRIKGELSIPIPFHMYFNLQWNKYHQLDFCNIECLSKWLSQD